jgi:hypothetical protein
MRVRSGPCHCGQSAALIAATLHITAAAADSVFLINVSLSGDQVNSQRHNALINSQLHNAQLPINSQLPTPKTPKTLENTQRSG